MEHENVDIFLLQETTKDLLAQINKDIYFIVEPSKGDSAIILRKDKIQKFHNT